VNAKIHRTLNIVAGLLILGLIGYSVHSFIDLNSPDKGILTLAGLLRIVCPVLASGGVWVVRWFHRAIVPAAAGVATVDRMKSDTLDGLRILNARLSRAGKYAEVNVIADAEAKLGGMFK
jgi:hypothetical protein